MRYLLDQREFRTQSPVDAEDLIVYDGRGRKHVEDVGELLPELDAVSPLALVVEPVYSIDGRALVVSPEGKEVLEVLDFVRQDANCALYALVAPDQCIVGCNTTDGQMS